MVARSGLSLGAAKLSSNARQDPGEGLQDQDQDQDVYSLPIHVGLVDVCLQTHAYTCTLVYRNVV